MPLITLRDVRVRFRGPPLLDNVSCHIEAGQRIGLLGRNGAGKTTLMRLVAGDLKPDGGEVLLAPGTRVAMLRQDVPQDVGGTIAEVVARSGARTLTEAFLARVDDAERPVHG
jgi:ATP-binding cassette subfamily F protein uup